LSKQSARPAAGQEEDYDTIEPSMGAGTGGAGWASAHPGKNQGGHGPPWKF